MSGFARGVADAMLEGRTAGAESAAAHASADADHARGMLGLVEKRLQSSMRHADELDVAWRQRTTQLIDELKKRTATCSGAFVVINAVLKVMDEEMSPSQRERFRQLVASKARARILELDVIHASNPERVSIAENFKNESPNVKLGVL